jgi:hypothetical protein
MLISHMSEGLSFEAFGGVVGVCAKTLYNWEDSRPEFLQAKKVGESMSRLYWEKVGRDGLYNECIKDGDGMTVTKSINATIWIFNMKNRFNGATESRKSIKTTGTTGRLLRCLTPNS